MNEEGWKQEALKRIDRQEDEEVKAHMEYIRNAKLMARVARKIVEASDVEVYPRIEPICGEVNIWNANNVLPHHLSKRLHLTLKKNFQGWKGAVTYVVNFEGAKVRIHDVKDIPRCEIKPHKETVTETKMVYEIVCK